MTRVKAKGKRRECLVCGIETNNKFCPKCGEYAPIKVTRACPDCRTETTAVICPECGKQTVGVDKDGYFNANKLTRVCPNCGEKTVDRVICPNCKQVTIDIIGANWTPVDDVHLFLKNFFARFFKKGTLSF